MIDRFLYTAIETGLADITADINLIDDIFGQFELPTAELEAIKTYYAANPIQLVHNYPRRNLKPPIVAIVLESESEETHFLADDAPPVIGVPAFEGVEISSALFRARYGVHVITELPDVTRYLFEILKTIMFRNEGFFADRGIHNIQIGGQDLALDPQFSPENYFIRKLTFQATYEFCEFDRDPQGRFTSIDGLFVDSSGSSGDVGDVQTLITVGNPEE